jgi:hypothetical protein
MSATLISTQVARGLNPSGRTSKSDPGILDGVSGFFSFQGLHEFGEASPRSIATLTIPDQTPQSHDSLPKEGAPNPPYRNPISER